MQGFLRRSLECLRSRQAPRLLSWLLQMSRRPTSNHLRRPRGPGLDLCSEVAKALRAWNTPHSSRPKERRSGLGQRPNAFSRGVERARGEAYGKTRAGPSASLRAI
jgi:hypothetical protein